MQTLLDQPLDDLAITRIFNYLKHFPNNEKGCLDALSQGALRLEDLSEDEDEADNRKFGL